LPTPTPPLPSSPSNSELTTIDSIISDSTLQRGVNVGDVASSSMPSPIGRQEVAASSTDDEPREGADGRGLGSESPPTTSPIRTTSTLAKPTES
jgi:hypothetical protein